MSTYVYLACLDHEPPLIAQDESTQHRHNEPEMFLVQMWVDHRETLVDAVERGQIRYRGVGNSTTSYFATNTAWFLSQHMSCRLCARDEYGEWIDLGAGVPGVDA